MTRPMMFTSFALHSQICCSRVPEILSNPASMNDFVALVKSLLTQALGNENGEVRPFALGDIVVVAPFNAQVNLLRRHLPPGTRVGTVDKFQGQEAAVAIVSMATSNGADAPRGSDFLFNANRLNVAISRAQSLAILVRGKDLLEMRLNSIADLRRLEGFARANVAHAT